MKGARLISLATVLAAGNCLAHPEHEFLAGLSAPSPATVLLVTSPELVKAWKPFAAWKKQMGKPIRILSTKQIDDRYEAPDLQEKIRRCVRNHTDHLGTRWIILAGDCGPDGTGLVPTRHSVHRIKEGDVALVPSDVFYLSKKDWDADDDGFFGEWEDDRDSIGYPDGNVGLGRIPVRTAEDVKAYTEKVIAYESLYPLSDFATRMTYVCADPAAAAGLRSGWDDQLGQTFKDGAAEYLFAEATPGDRKSAGNHPLNPANLVKLLNEKRTGKIHIHGNGSRPGWELGDRTHFTVEDVARLTNKNAYPIITTTAGFTGAFDSGKDPAIAEAMIRHPEAGAIAVVAPSREGQGKEASQITAQFWEQGIGQKVSAGAAMMLAKAGLSEQAEESAASHLALCELNLLGDPTLSLRVTDPIAPEAAGPKSLQAGNLSLVIESGAPHSMVSLLDTYGLYAVQVSDETGNVLYPINVVKDSQLTITISGPDLNAITLEIPVN